MIVPTIGRQVWFYPDANTRSAGKQPYAATVVFVHGDRAVNLSVLDHDGNLSRAVNVPLLQDDDGAPREDAFCQWMPYQLSQARTQPSSPEDLTQRVLAERAHGSNSGSQA